LLCSFFAETTRRKARLGRPFIWIQSLVCVGGYIGKPAGCFRAAPRRYFSPSRTKSRPLLPARHPSDGERRGLAVSGRGDGAPLSKDRLGKVAKFLPQRGCFVARTLFPADNNHHPTSCPQTRPWGPARGTSWFLVLLYRFSSAVFRGPKRQGQIAHAFVPPQNPFLDHARMHACQGGEGGRRRHGAWPASGSIELICVNREHWVFGRFLASSVCERNPRREQDFHDTQTGLHWRTCDGKGEGGGLYNEGYIFHVYE